MHVVWENSGVYMKEMQNLGSAKSLIKSGFLFSEGFMKRTVDVVEYPLYISCRIPYLVFNQ